MMDVYSVDNTFPRQMILCAQSACDVRATISSIQLYNQCLVDHFQSMN